MTVPDLVMLYPQIPFEATTSIASSEDPDHKHENLSYGARSNIWKAGASANTQTITYSLSSAQTFDHIVLSRADLLTDLGTDIDIEIRSSSTNFLVDDDLEVELPTVAASDLTGPRKQDLIIEPRVPVSPAQFWRLKITSSSSYTYLFSKFFLGSFFTFGDRAPIYPYTVQPTNNSRGFTADSGSVYRTRSGPEQLEFRYTWKVTDAVAADFYDKIGRYWDVFTFYLYAPNPNCQEVLREQKLVHVHFAERPEIESRGPIKDQNYISCTFVQEV